MATPAKKTYLVLIENKDTFNIVEEVLKTNGFENIEEEEKEKISTSLESKKNVGIVIESGTFSWFAAGKSKTIDQLLTILKDTFSGIESIPVTMIPLVNKE
jgi:hypothetical protein